MAQLIAKCKTMNQAKRLRDAIADFHKDTLGIAVEGYKVREIADKDRRAEVYYQMPPIYGKLSPMEKDRHISWAQGWLAHDRGENPDELIYLASPLSHDDPAVMESRFEAVCHVAAGIFAAGKMVFSPIAHTYPIAVRGGLPHGFDFYERYDRLMIGKSTVLSIAQIPGWEKSDGIRREIEIANELNVPIEHVHI